MGNDPKLVARIKAGYDIKKYTSENTHMFEYAAFNNDA